MVFFFSHPYLLGGKSSTLCTGTRLQTQTYPAMCHVTLLYVAVPLVCLHPDSLLSYPPPLGLCQHGVRSRLPAQAENTPQLADPPPNDYTMLTLQCATSPCCTSLSPSSASTLTAMLRRGCADRCSRIDSIWESSSPVMPSSLLRSDSVRAWRSAGGGDRYRG